MSVNRSLQTLQFEGFYVNIVFSKMNFAFEHIGVRKNIKKNKKLPLDKFMYN